MAHGICYTQSGNVKRYEESQWWDPSSDYRGFIKEYGENVGVNDPSPNILYNNFTLNTSPEDAEYTMNGLIGDKNAIIKSYEYFPDPPFGYLFMGVRTMYGDKVRWVITSAPNSNDKIPLTSNDIVINNVRKVSINENHQIDTAFIGVTIPPKCRLTISDDGPCVCGVTIQNIDPLNFTSNSTQSVSISVACRWRGREQGCNSHIMCNSAMVKLELTALGDSDYGGSVIKKVEVADS